MRVLGIFVKHHCPSLKEDKHIQKYKTDYIYICCATEVFEAIMFVIKFC